MNLKKVNIDAHIKNSKASGSETTTKRKRGRPRKNPAIESSGHGSTDHDTGGLKSGDASSNSSFDASGSGSPINHSSANQQSVPPTVEPIYDTTAEAKGILQTPFAIFAMLFKNNQLMLDDQDTDVLMPSWKPIYDEDLKPFMGEHAKYISFGSALSVVLIKKYQVLSEMKKQADRIEKAKKDFEEMKSAPPNKNESMIPVTLV